MKLLTVAILAISLLAGCLTNIEEDPAPETNPAPQTVPAADETKSPEFIKETWSCDGGEIKLWSSCFPEGSGKGLYGNDLCFAYVQIGNYPAKGTGFRIAGTERIWNWGHVDGGYKYTFIIGSRSYGDKFSGRYYDFTGVPAGERIKPRGVHDCSKTD